MKSLVLIFLLLGIPVLSQAQENFIRVCKSADKTEVQSDEIKWLSDILKTTDCELLAKIISEKKSFTEILPPGGMTDAIEMQKSWVHDIPHYLGLKGQNTYPFQKDDKKNYFYTPDLLTEFKNLTHIDLADLKHEPICEYIAKLPALKTIRLKPDDFFSKEVDECLSKAGIKVFISNVFDVLDIKFKPKSIVIGIESWYGGLTPLKEFLSLEYLHIEEAGSHLKFASLASLSNFTHLSIHTKTLKNFEGIRHLLNLKFLTIQPPVHKMEFTTLSATNHGFLSDISFVEDLYSLEHLNFSNNSIQDLKPILELENLKVLRLRNNFIQHIPDLSNLTNLQKADLSYNKITSLSEISKANNLKFLNLTFNNLSDLSPLEDLSFLEYLNLSRMSLGKRVRLPPMRELKYLVMDGFSGKQYLFPFLTMIGLELNSKSAEEQQHIAELLGDSFSELTSADCKSSLFFDSIEGIADQKELRYLSVSGQNLDGLPGVHELKNLSYLDFSYIPRDPKLNLMGLKLDTLRLNGTSKVHLSHEPDYMDYFETRVYPGMEDGISDVCNISELK